MTMQFKQIPLIIVIYPYGFRKFDWERFELSFLERTCKVQVCELVELLNPVYAKAYHERIENEQVARFTSLNKWIAFIRDQTNNTSRKVIIFNFVPVTGILEFKVNLELARSKCIIVDFYLPGVPDFMIEDRVLFDRIIQTTKKILNKNSWNSKFRGFKYLAYQKLMEAFKLYPHYRVIAGKYFLDNQLSYCQKRGISILLGNSWDYSRLLRKNTDFESPEKYAVLLDGAGPMFASDSLISKEKVYFTSDVWYPILTSFLDKLEEEFNCQIIISAHPKTVHEEFPVYFGGRRVVHGNSLELVKNSQFVITRMSTAISYAIEYIKPCVFIYSDQLMEDNHSMRVINCMSGLLGVSPVNMNDRLSSAELKMLMNINLSKYKEYKINYLTSAEDFTPNYEILLKELGL